MSSGRRKSEQLGMPHATAAKKLQKVVILFLLKQQSNDTCLVCGQKIETPDELSLKHKQGWLNEDVKLYWDPANIAFCHSQCEPEEEE